MNTLTPTKLRSLVRESRARGRNMLAFREKALELGLIEPHGLVLPSLSRKKVAFRFHFERGTMAMQNATPDKVYRLIKLAALYSDGDPNSDFVEFFKLGISTPALSQLIAVRNWEIVRLSSEIAAPITMLSDWLKEQGKDPNSIRAN